MTEVITPESFREFDITAYSTNDAETQAMMIGDMDPSIDEMFGFTRSGDLARYVLAGRVLDLGSDAHENLSYLFGSFANPDMSSPHVNPYAPVFSLNPDYASPALGTALREAQHKNPNWLHRSVAAWGDEMPFADESFRGIFALASSMTYAGVDTNYVLAYKTLAETLRIMEPGGLFVGIPMLPEFRHTDYRGDLIGETKSLLGDLQLQYNFEYVLDQASIRLPGGKTIELNDANKGPIWRLAIKKN